MSVSSPPVGSSAQVVVQVQNPLSDDEFDGVLVNMDVPILTPPSSPPVNFTQSWAASERQRVVSRRRDNLIRVTNLKVRYEKMKRNRIK